MSAEVFCHEAGCGKRAAAQCAYIDGKREQCPTWWCATDIFSFGKSLYCRRHFNTLSALGARANDPKSIPDASNRAASLVNFVWKAAHDELTPVIVDGCSEGEVVFEDRSVNAIVDGDGSRMWQRGWRIADAQGIVDRIMIGVKESDDSRVLILLNEDVKTHATPPWIARRGDEVNEGIADQNNRQFYGRLERDVKAAIHSR